MEPVIVMIMTLPLVRLVLFAEGAFRIILSLLFLFLLSYRLVDALFPKKGSLDTIKHITQSFVASIVIVLMIGIILNYIWEISFYPVIITIAMFILLASVITLNGRESFPMMQGFEPKLRYRVL